MSFGRLIGWVFLIVGLILVFIHLIKNEFVTNALTFFHISEVGSQIFGGLIAIAGVIIIMMERDEQFKRHF